MIDAYGTIYKGTSPSRSSLDLAWTRQYNDANMSLKLSVHLTVLLETWP